MLINSIPQEPEDLPAVGHEKWQERASSAWESNDFSALGRCARELEQISPELRAQERERRADAAAWDLARAADTIEAYARYLARKEYKFFKDEAEQATRGVQTKNDQQAWNKTQAQDTPQAYYDYIARTGAKSHADEAEERIAMLLNEEDSLLWVEAQRKDTIKAYKEYLAHGGPLRFRDNAGIAIYRLQERHAWQAAVQASSGAGYEDYLAWVSEKRRELDNEVWYPTLSHPNEALARERIDDLDWTQASAKGGLEALRAYMLGSPPRRHSAEAKAREAELLELLWSEARGQNQKQGYHKYLELAGEGALHASEAHAALDRLLSEEQVNETRRQDEALWGQLSGATSIADYQKYLQLVGPTALHGSEAQAAISRLALDEQERLKEREQQIRQPEPPPPPPPVEAPYTGPAAPPVSLQEEPPEAHERMAHAPGLILTKDWDNAELAVMWEALCYDLKLWNAATLAGSPQAFDRYMDMCPVGRKRLAAIMRADELRWREAEASGDIKLLKAYHARPDARFVLQARQLLSAKLGRGELVSLVNLLSQKHAAEIEEDNRQWSEVEQADTTLAYRRFLWPRPLRSSAKTARERLEKLLWDKARSSGGLKDWVGYLCADPPELDEDPFAEAPASYTVRMDIAERLNEAAQRVRTLAEATRWDIDLRAISENEN